MAGDPQPLVSVVTPSLNSGRFLAEAIESVLSQDYPAIEYIIMDGGSIDDTAAIAARYQGRLQFVSEPDAGTADAINRGFAKSHGEIIAWLSADDIYMPGAIATAASRFRSQPEAAVVYGEGYWMDEFGAKLGRYPTQAPYHAAMFARECCVCQPACFMRREAFEAAGGLDVSLHSAFDYDLWARMSQRHPFSAVPEYLAASRMHRDNKSLGSKRVMFEENLALLRRHYGYIPLNWVYGYLSFLRDGRDQFFEPLQESAAAYLAALPTGSYYNQRHLLRFWAEWAGRLIRRAIGTP